MNFKLIHLKNIYLKVKYRYIYFLIDFSFKISYRNKNIYKFLHIFCYFSLIDILSCTIIKQKFFSMSICNISLKK